MNREVRTGTRGGAGDAARDDARQGPLMDLVRRHARRLESAGVVSPVQDVLTLASHALATPPAELRTHAVDEVEPAGLDRLSELVESRARRVPLQHLTGTTGFRTLTLTCRSGVFVPRPETEVLAGLAIDHAGRGNVVVEPCTGTGAVALAVAAEAPATTVVGTDRDPVAVELARHNAARLGLEVEVLRGDLLAPVDPSLRGRVDVLVANPPYLTPDELAACEPEVREHDPVGALVSGPRGHEISDRLIAEARAWLRPTGILLLEIAEARAAEVAARVRAAGFRGVEVTDDLTGRERIVRGEAP